MVGKSEKRIRLMAHIVMVILSIFADFGIINRGKSGIELWF